MKHFQQQIAFRCHYQILIIPKRFPEKIFAIQIRWGEHILHNALTFPWIFVIYPLDNAFCVSFALTFYLLNTNQGNHQDRTYMYSACILSQRALILKYYRLSCEYNIVTNISYPHVYFWYVSPPSLYLSFPYIQRCIFAT